MTRKDELLKEDGLQLADLAFMIADEHSAGLIDSVTVETTVDGEEWLTFGDGPQCRTVQEDCADEIDYLEARGLLHRHPVHTQLVRIEWENL